MSTHDDDDDDDDDMAPPVISLGLHRIHRLLASLSSPHLRVPVVHVAGTNGKGSVCAFVASILEASGYSVGRFNSPHLVEPRDSIVVDGDAITVDEFARVTAMVERVNRVERVEATPFEKLTATAFVTFATRPVDVAVVEVGMGGRGDATNVGVPANTLVSAITPVALDHQAFLGNTVVEIANVKAGIVKRHVPVVCGRLSPAVDHVMQSTALELECDVYFTNEASTTLPAHPRRVVGQALPLHEDAVTATLPLAGQFQAENASQAILIAQVLRYHSHPTSLIPTLRHQITLESITKGLESTRWRGRLQHVTCHDVDVLVDGAHNPSASTALAQYLSTLPINHFTFVVAVSAPRDVQALFTPIFSTLQSNSITMISTTFSKVQDMPWVTSLDPVEMQQTFSTMTQQFNNVQVGGHAVDVQHAIELAVKLQRDDVDKHQIVVCGSLYLVADVFRYIS